MKSGQGWVSALTVHSVACTSVLSLETGITKWLIISPSEINVTSPQVKHALIKAPSPLPPPPSSFLVLLLLLLHLSLLILPLRGLEDPQEAAV